MMKVRVRMMTKAMKVKVMMSNLKNRITSFKTIKKRLTNKTNINSFKTRD